MQDRPLPADPTAAGIISRLGLSPHPEGGWYRETFRAPAEPGQRSLLTSIHFLLCAGERSHWHRVDVVETWRYAEGDPLELRILLGDHVELVRLGPTESDHREADVPRGLWQSAVGTGAWTLVTCDCRPGFEFSGFELAPPGWEPGD